MRRIAAGSLRQIGMRIGTSTSGAKPGDGIDEEAWREQLGGLRRGNRQPKVSRSSFLHSGQRMRAKPWSRMPPSMTALEALLPASLEALVD